MAIEGLVIMEAGYNMPWSPNGEVHFRQTDRAGLFKALKDSRESMLHCWQAYRAALDDALTIPYALELNTPRWELGHIGWFEEFWIARHPDRHLGLAASPASARWPSLLNDADRFYNSSAVPHHTRWELPLPDAEGTVAYVSQVREQTLEIFPKLPDDELYFVQLSIVHEDMHKEAWVYMAQTLGIPGPWPTFAEGSPRAEIDIPAQTWRQGTSEPGFAFDNELPAHPVRLAKYTIDTEVLHWADYLPFLNEGGYENPLFWTRDGWAWCEAQRQTHGVAKPRYLRRQAGDWEIQRFGTWMPLDLSKPAVHLTFYEAQAWCTWAQRRLPTEAEWELAAFQHPDHFHWGQVWEWTASSHAPFIGYQPHPYRDYSRPWFDGRPVLKGASIATSPRMKHPRYRNYFTAERNDIFAGFRTCALDH